MMKPTLAALLLALGLAGCAGSAPMTYLVLSPTPGQVYGQTGATIAVARVSMPPTIDRSFLTTGSGENRVEVSYNAQWAAPLGSMAQSALARDLAARLPHHMVLMPGDHVPQNAEIVTVNVSQFLPYPGYVRLEADWRSATPSTLRAQTGRVAITVPTADTPEAQAQAMSEALGQLADQIAAQIATE